MRMNDAIGFAILAVGGGKAEMSRQSQGERAKRCSLNGKEFCSFYSNPICNWKLQMNLHGLRDFRPAFSQDWFFWKLYASVCNAVHVPFSVLNAGTVSQEIPCDF